MPTPAGKKRRRGLPRFFHVLALTANPAARGEKIRSCTPRPSPDQGLDVISRAEPTVRNTGKTRTSPSNVTRLRTKSSCSNPTVTLKASTISNSLCIESITKAEAYLRAYGCVAMDPADVTKVMRQETAQWIKDSNHPVVAAVHKRLFGCCESNWMTFNSAHDVSLPSAKGAKLGFFMYSVAENAGVRLDSYAPDDFR
jgi:hypothetical protein